MITQKKISYLCKILGMALIYLVPLIIVLHDVFFSNINFWYDPARDFLLGLSNLEKFTLIGPTSGIPGIFYGPYWIWLISLGLLFSKDPSIVIFLILTLPYFIFFPYLLYKFRKIFKKETLAIVWILFVFNTGIYYAQNPWNPHIAPLLFMLLIYTITFTDLLGKSISSKINILFIGLLSGLIINFHISFGLGIFVGTTVFLTMSIFKKVSINKFNPRKMLSFHLLKIFIFWSGALITFLPFIIFELRHGFNQVKTTLNLFYAKGSVVAVTGLSRDMILQNFFGSGAGLLKMQNTAFSLFLFLGLGYIFYLLVKGKVKYDIFETRLIMFIFSVICGILSLYLTSKNPVWPYHFIGVEIIFLLIIAIFIDKNLLLRRITLLIAFYIFFLNATSIPKAFSANQLTSHSLATQKYIVKTIHIDSKGKEYTVFAYSPSVYVYEYDYLFNWLFKKDVPYDPNANPHNSNLVYLIIPPVDKNIAMNFINASTPDTNYVTSKKWDIPDGTTILKRSKK